MTKCKINVALVDDHVMFRKTLFTYLSQRESIDVIFQASDVSDLYDKLKNSTIDVLVIDLFMPDITGSEALVHIRNEYPELKLIVLSMCTDISLVNDLLDIGIHGYISKSDEPDELLTAIQAAFDNRIYRNKIFTEALYWNRQKNIRLNSKCIPVKFDDREKTIIRLLWEEKSNKEIAEELFLSVRSIEKIRQDLKEKLGVRSTVGILKYALNKKIIDMNEKVMFVNPADVRIKPLPIEMKVNSLKIGNR